MKDSQLSRFGKNKKKNKNKKQQINYDHFQKKGESQNNHLVINDRQNVCFFKIKGLAKPQFKFNNA